MRTRTVLTPAPAVLYARVSSKDQDREGFSIPAQLDLLRSYACANGHAILREFVDVETAKRTGRTGFGEMIALMRKEKPRPILLVEKTDRLYRNLKDWVTIDDLGLGVHFVKENFVLSPESRSSEKFMHGIKVLMAKNYIDNLAEETKKGMLEKARQGIWPSFAPLGYLNVAGPDGKRAIAVDCSNGRRCTRKEYLRPRRSNAGLGEHMGFQAVIAATRVGQAILDA
ncbi:MAG TPA: recombinase family protein, partial [Bryobacteraceae bacterium]|nr:recombinase family protein [Bryobacteraceae bacterium]